MTWLVGLLFIAGAVTLGILPAQLLKRRYAGVLPDDTVKLASDVMLRIGGLHGLIMALVFAAAQGEVQALKSNIDTEAGAVTHVFFNAHRMGNAAIQKASRTYLDAVLKDDWQSLAEHSELSNSGWQAWRDMLDATLNVEPHSPRDAQLLTRIQSDVWRIEDLRQERGFKAAESVPVAFWLVAVVGLTLIASLLFVHEINRLHQTIMAMYSAYMGMVLFLIVDLSHPFKGMLAITPDAFIAAQKMIAVVN